MHLLRFSFVLFGLTASAAFAAPLAATSTITAATVYADRAVVTRSTRVDIPTGETSINFALLPVGIDESSLQVNGHGLPATILDVTARTVHDIVTADPRLKALEAELTEVERKDRAVVDKLAVLDQQNALLRKIENASTTPAANTAGNTNPGTVVALAAPSASSFEAWQKLLTFSADNSIRIATERQSLDQQRETFAREITKLTSQIQDIRVLTPNVRSTKTVTVRVASTQAGALDLNLSYALGGAQWGAAYDARFRSEDRSLELTYFGLVINQTGEDWKNIALTLSTARPNLGGGTPELEPWHIEANRPSESKSGFSLFASRKPKRPDPSATVLGPEGGLSGAGLALDSRGGNASGDRELIIPEPQITLEVSQLATSATSASFKIPASATVLSEKSIQKVGIATTTLAAALEYKAAPKVLETVFLSASTTNPTDYPLLGGQVSTFVDGTFVATSDLETVMPAEKFHLNLGADEGVSIKRKLVNRLTEDTGFSNKNRRITYDVLITVTNKKCTAEHIIINDILPVSRDEKVVVKLLSPAEKDVGTKEKPGREVTREENAQLVWRINLKAGEKREIPLKFYIDYPSDFDLTGVE